MMNLGPQSIVSTEGTTDFIGFTGRNSSQGSQGGSAAPVDQQRVDVLQVYADIDNAIHSSLFNGGIDTGLDYGKFSIDTSNNIGTAGNQVQQSQDVYAERFVGPFARTQLNQLSWLDSESDESSSERQANSLMQ
jgi:hypothetical protein